MRDVIFPDGPVFHEEEGNLDGRGRSQVLRRHLLARNNTLAIGGTGEGNGYLAYDYFLYSAPDSLVLLLLNQSGPGADFVDKSGCRVFNPRGYEITNHRPGTNRDRIRAAGGAPIEVFAFEAGRDDSR